MPALQQPFNSSQYDPATGFSQLPVGEHPVVIVASSIEGNKQQNGGYVKFSVKAIDGPANGLSMDYRVNLYNANQKSVEIAQRQMSAICHAVGVTAFHQTEELHGKPFVVVVQPQKDDDKYNEISSVKYIDGSQIKPGQYGVAGGGQAQGQGQANGGAQGGWGGAPANNGGGQPQGNGQGQAQGQQGGNPAWGGAPANGGNNGQGQPAQGNGGGQAWGNGAPAANNGGQQGGNAGWQQGGAPANKPAWG